MRNWTPYRLMIQRLRSSGLRKTADEASVLYNLAKTAEVPLSALAKFDTDDHVGKDDHEMITVTVSLGDIRIASKYVGTAAGSALQRSDAAKSA